MSGVHNVNIRLKKVLHSVPPLLQLPAVQNSIYRCFSWQRQTAARLLSTNFALLIAVWPSLSPIELDLYAFIAAPLTAVSRLRFLIKCLSMWFILPSTFKITSFDGSPIQELTLRLLFFFNVHFSMAAFIPGSKCLTNKHQKWLLE